MLNNCGTFTTGKQSNVPLQIHYVVVKQDNGIAFGIQALTQPQSKEVYETIDSQLEIETVSPLSTAGSIRQLNIVITPSRHNKAEAFITKKIQSLRRIWNTLSRIWDILP